MKTIKLLFRAISALNKAMFAVIGAIVTIVSIMVFYDVIARYVFGKPSSFGFDLSTWLTGAAAFLGGGYLLMQKGHIKIDILYEKFSEKTRRVADILSYILILIVVLVLVKFGLDQVLFLYERGSVASSGLNIPLWIRWLIVPVGGILLGLQTLVFLTKDLYFLFTGKEIEEGQ